MEEIVVQIIVNKNYHLLTDEQVIALEQLLKEVNELKERK